MNSTDVADKPCPAGGPHTGPPLPWWPCLARSSCTGEDIRRPLGLKHKAPDAALLAVADNYKNSNLLIGAKRRIAGLCLRATDVEWAYGDGPEVSGPLASLIIAMTGRKHAHPDLSSDGLAVLASRP